MMHSNWRSDKFLSILSDRLDDYDVFSFDVFDTLLFRDCREPGDIFERVGQRSSEQCAKWEYSPIAYRALRIEAEYRARSRKPRGSDCTFDEIFAEMPFDSEIIRLLRQFEIACEMDALYLNDNVYSLMCECRARGRKIVIVSDMYHSGRRILDYLSNAGVDTRIIDDVFVSSECGCFKAGGHLFGQLLAKYAAQDASRVLHIGDNLRSDIDGAESIGIAALHYGVVPGEFGGTYDYERYVYDVRLGGIQSLRKLSAASSAGENGDAESAMFALGAETIGPLYALFADWVLRTAERRGIKLILPFMREGELMSQVIRNAIAASGTKIACEPLYISRRPVFAASYFEHNYDARICQALLRDMRTIADMFGELGLDLEHSAFADVPTQTLAELKSDDRLPALDAYLHGETVKRDVLAYAKRQRELLTRYLSGMTDGRAAMTVDIGTRGTTERHLRDIANVKSDFPKLSHVLMMGSAVSNCENILNGVDITAWLGIAGENDKIIGKLMYQMAVIEVLVNAVCGTVLSYREENGAPVPVLADAFASERQKRMVVACWRGALEFQRRWIELAIRKPKLRNILFERKADFLNIWLRLIEMPSVSEAEHLGGLYHWDDFFFAEARRLRPDGIIEGNIQNFLAAALRNGMYYPQAAVASQCPAYFAERLLRAMIDDARQPTLLAVLDDVRSNGYKKGVIFGASELGRKYQKLAALLNVPIACFTDSDKRLHGTAIGGVPVVALDDVPEDVDYIAVGSYVHANEMIATLEAKYANVEKHPKIFALGGVLGE
jgi:FMN phosphatase YigB (HAD superfamily)